MNYKGLLGIGFSFVLVGWADSPLIHRDGDRVIVVPDTIRAQIQQRPGEETQCDEIIKKLEKNRAGIARCLDSVTLKPKTYCELLKIDLQRDILGTNTLVNAADSDVEQGWSIQISSKAVATAVVPGLSSQMGFNVDQIVLGNPGKIEVKRVQLNWDPSSFSALLNQASVLDLKPVIENAEEEGVPFLRTRNRLTTCELLSNKVFLTGDAVVEYQYLAEKDRENRMSLWGLHQLLVQVKQGTTSDWKKFVLSGFHFANYLMNQNQPVEDARIDYLDSLFLSHAEPTQFSLVSYRNEFHFSKFLPQIKKSTTQEYSFKGSVQ